MCDNLKLPLAAEDSLGRDFWKEPKHGMDLYRNSVPILYSIPLAKDSVLWAVSSSLHFIFFSYFGLSLLLSDNEAHSAGVTPMALRAFSFFISWLMLAWPLAWHRWLVFHFLLSAMAEHLCWHSQFCYLFSFAWMPTGRWYCDKRFDNSLIRQFVNAATEINSIVLRNLSAHQHISTFLTFPLYHRIIESPNYRITSAHFHINNIRLFICNLQWWRSFLFPKAHLQ